MRQKKIPLSNILFELAIAQKRHGRVHFALERRENKFRSGQSMVVAFAKNTHLCRIVCQNGTFDFL